MLGFFICRGKVCGSKRKNSHPIGRSLYLAQLRKRAYLVFSLTVIVSPSLTNKATTSGNK